MRSVSDFLAAPIVTDETGTLAGHKRRFSRISDTQIEHGFVSDSVSDCGIGTRVLNQG